jgi:hypothetical protein
MKILAFRGSILGEIQQLCVISKPPAIVGKRPLTGVEVKVRNDRFVIGSSRSLI